MEIITVLSSNTQQSVASFLGVTDVRWTACVNQNSATLWKVDAPLASACQGSGERDATGGVSYDKEVLEKVNLWRYQYGDEINVGLDGC